LEGWGANADVDERYEALRTDDVWSFGQPGRTIAPTARFSIPSEMGSGRSGAANEVAPSTTPKLLETHAIKPVSAPTPSFGKRGFSPTYEWEGVVEETNGSGFKARLFPIESESGLAGNEFAEFEFADLADDSDRDLITEGAIFYFTIGKSRNRAGTLFNTSLLRFRRLPVAGRVKSSAAASEAEALLANLGEAPST
jgi:hypothetical protein